VYAAGGQDHFTRSLGLQRPASAEIAHPVYAVTKRRQTDYPGTGQQVESAPVRRVTQMGAGGHAPAVQHRPVVKTETLERVGVEIVDQRQAGLGHGAQEGIGDGEMRSAAGDADGFGAAVPWPSASLASLRPLEEGQHVGEAPAGAARFVAPTVEVAGLSAQVHHAVIALPPPMVRPAISAPDCVKTRVAMVR